MAKRQVVQVGSAAGLRFAIRFASATDVSALRPRDLERLWRACRAFVGLPADAMGQLPGLAAKDQHGRRLELPGVRGRQLSDFAEMQRAARELLGRVSTGAAVVAEMEGRVFLDGDGFRFVGAPVEAFRMSLAWLLSGREGQRVRQCPECGLFFVRVRRQLYCRDECTDRATWRDYSPAKKRRARQKQYDKHGWTLGARSGRKGR